MGVFSYGPGFYTQLFPTSYETLSCTRSTPCRGHAHGIFSELPGIGFWTHLLVPNIPGPSLGLVRSISLPSGGSRLWAFFSYRPFSIILVAVMLSPPPNSHRLAPVVKSVDW